MQLRFFTVPIHASDAAAAELNRFLGGHRILSIERQLISDGANSAWTICVSFDGGNEVASSRTAFGKRGNVDFKGVLSEPEFAVFARLRALRKEKADAEGVPAYALFTNEQLAEMVQRRAITAAALREIAGIGEARADKYGDAFLHIVKDAALPEVPPALLRAAKKDVDGGAKPRHDVERATARNKDYPASLSSSSSVIGQASGSGCGGAPSIVAGIARSAWR